WGDPNNLERFLAHVSGRSHRAVYVFSRTPAEYMLRGKETARFIVSQFGVLLLLAGWGWIRLPSFRWKLFFGLVVVFDVFYTVFLNIISLEITAFNLPTTLVIAVLCGHGITGVAEVLEKGRPVHSNIRGVVRAAFFAVPAIFLVLNFGACNQSRNYTAYEHALNIFRTTGSRDIVFMNGDNYVFPILYGRIVEKIGEDMAIFDRNNIIFKWLGEDEKVVAYSEEWKDLRRKREREVIRGRGNRDVYYAVFGPYAIGLPEGFDLVSYGVLHRVVESGRIEEIPGLDSVWKYYAKESFYEEFQRDFMTREVAAYYHFNRGKALFHSGDIQRGVKTIMLASEIGFDDDLIHNDIAIFFIDRGFMREGRVELERALTYHDDLSGVYNNWGYYYHKLGDYERSSEYLEKAVELKPDDIGYLNNLGFALLKAGKKEEARKVYRRSLEMKPNQPDVVAFIEKSGLQLLKAEE
ncbi:MAG: tetratricopeptide repeat protein, partial [Deltaproteobacteria bacterium]|nr:tetratricopeptide repeat protein [Deltaproteobacteria bacterium]